MTTNHDMAAGESTAAYARRKGWQAGTPQTTNPMDSES